MREALGTYLAYLRCFNHTQLCLRAELLGSNNFSYFVTTHTFPPSKAKLPVSAFPLDHYSLNSNIDLEHDLELFSNQGLASELAHAPQRPEDWWWNFTQVPELYKITDREKKYFNGSLSLMASPVGSPACCAPLVHRTHIENQQEPPRSRLQSSLDAALLPVLRRWAGRLRCRPATRHSPFSGRIKRNNRQNVDRINFDEIYLGSRIPSYAYEWRYQTELNDKQA
ncbi:unnamed protein product, partial [Protopolystoma xenopodis]